MHEQTMYLYAFFLYGHQSWFIWPRCVFRLFRRGTLLHVVADFASCRSISRLPLPFSATLALSSRAFAFVLPDIKSHSHVAGLTFDICKRIAPYRV